jgi:hypothetical protein
MEIVLMIDELIAQLFIDNGDLLQRLAERAAAITPGEPLVDMAFIEELEDEVDWDDVASLILQQRPELRQVMIPAAP